MSNSPFSRRGKNSRRKMNAKISKLENQVQAIQTRQDGGPVGGAAYGGTNVLGDQEDMSAPGVYSGGAVAAAGQNAIAQIDDNSLDEDDVPELDGITNTIGSVFGPGTAAVGNSMFGTTLPGSFDRDMG